MNTHDDYDFDTEPTVAREAWRRNIAVLIVLAGLSVIFLAGYALRGSQADRSGAAGAAAHPSSSATPTPTSGDAPPSPVTNPTTARGPAVNSAGVLVGYAHDEGGAVAAAGNYVTALYIHTDRTPAREQALLDSIADTQADASRMAADFSSEDVALARMLSISNLQVAGTIAFGYPIGYHISAYSPTTATIDVHVVGGQGMSGAADDSDDAATTFYEVDRLQVTWRQHDWRLANWSRLEDNGPQLGSIAAQTYSPFPIGETGSQP